MAIVHLAVVDDLKDVEFIYRAKLRNEVKQNILKIFYFEGGERLLDFLRNCPNDIRIIILISDINMPGMDGLTLTKIINAEFPHIDVYLSSAYDQSDNRERMGECCFLDYLEKPVDFNRIKEIILEKHRLLEREESSDGPIGP